MQRRHTPAALITLCAGLSASATEFHFTQITDTPFGYGMFEPSVNADGTLVAFSAAYDFTGENPEQNFEVYLYDAIAETYTQLTDSPSEYGHFRPLITPDGEYVVFRTPYDYTGGNLDASFELYQVRVADLIITQLTDNPQYTGLFTPKMSGDGEYVVYRSNGDPVGTNGDANFEVFRLARTTGVIDQITVTPPPNLNDFPASNGDGSRIVFRSRYDFDGSNPNGNIEIWMWDELAGVTAVTQTNIPQESTSPAVDGAGRFVAFISRYDFTGQNPGGTLEIFVKDTLDGTFAQVTTSGPLLHLEPVVSPGGTFLIFESQRDPLGQNPDANREIFHYDIAGGVLAQLTDTTGGASIPGLSDRAQVNYAAIARDAPVFAIRNEHSLEPGFPNVGDNLELFLTEGRLRGDLNGDGCVGHADLGILLSDWMCDSGDCPGDCDADGDTDQADLGLLLAHWGEGCP